MKQKFALLIAVVLLIGLIVAVNVARTKQEQRSRASEATATTPGSYGYDNYATSSGGLDYGYGGEQATPSAVATPTAAFQETPTMTVAPTENPEVPTDTPVATPTDTPEPTPAQ